MPRRRESSVSETGIVVPHYCSTTTKQYLHEEGLCARGAAPPVKETKENMNICKRK